MGLFLLSGAVLAQPGSSPGPWLPPAPGASEVQVPMRPSISPEQMLKSSTELRKNMVVVAHRIEGQLEAAREDRDLIRINCLGDKLIQVKANLNVADKSFRDMQEAIRRDNEGAAFDQYSRIAVLNQNVQTLVIEADNCIGVDMSVVGAVKIDVSTENVPGGDPTQPEEEEELSPGVTRPPPASPFF